MPIPFQLLPGLSAELQNLLSVPHTPGEDPQTKAVAYFIVIRNHSPLALQIIGRKWVLESNDGQTLVVEGDGVVGQAPLLEPGTEFSYNSHHQFSSPTMATGTFFALTATGQPVRCELAPFKLDF